MADENEKTPDDADIAADLGKKYEVTRLPEEKPLAPQTV